MRHISVCIPTYEMHGKGPGFLRESFERLSQQTFRDFDVVVSDNAEDGSIKAVCDEYADRLEIVYTKNPDGKNMCDNTNNAFLHATGKILKILFMDDIFHDAGSLAIIAKNFDLEHDAWLVTSCTNTKDGETFYGVHQATYTEYIEYGRNTIGTPSVVAVKNKNPVQFDARFKWTLNDCDYYKSNFERFGFPKILDDVNVAIRIHPDSVTNTLATTSARRKEFFLMLKKRGDHIFSHPAIFRAYLNIWRKMFLEFFKKHT